jgi:hypothetical protein
MYKKGKSKMSPAMAFMALGIVAVIGLLMYVSFFRTGQTVISPGTPTTTGSGCNQNPSLSLIGTNALVPSSNVSPTTVNYRVNGVYIGTTYSTPAYNDKVELIGDLAGYLASSGTTTVSCGPNNLAIPTFYQYTNATVSVYTDAGTAILSNSAAGGVINETALGASGGSKNWKVHMLGVSQKSTGKIFMVVELPSGSATNVSASGVSLSGLTQVAIPNGVSATNTNPTRVAFEIPALVNGEVRDYNLQMNTLASKTTSGVVRITFFAEQKFVDTDGVFKEGIYDSLSTAKYQDSYTYDFVILPYI